MMRREWTHSVELPNPPLQADGRVGRFAPSYIRR